MGLFDIFKSKNNGQSGDQAPPGKKIVSVDDIYLISVPQEWNTFESDRFRMQNADGSVRLSISNYGREGTEDDFSIEDLKAQMLPLLKKFVTEGGYESLNDLEIGKNYIYQSFKVDEETQYYFYTWRNVKQSQLVISAFCIRAIGPFSQQLKDTLKATGESIMHKVSYR